jgi:hypothetical protein
LREGRFWAKAGAADRAVGPINKMAKAAHGKFRLKKVRSQPVAEATFSSSAEL